VARGMCDDSAARAKGKKNLYLQKTQSDMVPSQLRLARANALVDAAETMLRHDIAEYMAMATTPERITLEVRARLRMHAAQELHFATEAVDTLFVDGGTSAMFDGSTLQRAFRDVHAIHSHVAMNHDNAAENFGRILLDLPPNSPLI
jgi:alkylation response protein AidB-like acyl-CoA dehydrogenase